HPRARQGPAAAAPFQDAHQPSLSGRAGIRQDGHHEAGDDELPNCRAEDLEAGGRTGCVQRRPC
ncbi:hypothetical protein CH063_09483, partial [Colletotrichum higginsianum]